MGSNYQLFFIIMNLIKYYITNFNFMYSQLIKWGTHTRLGFWLPKSRWLPTKLKEVSTIKGVMTEYILCPKKYTVIPHSSPTYPLNEYRQFVREGKLLVFFLHPLGLTCCFTDLKHKFTMEEGVERFLY